MSTRERSADRPPGVDREQVGERELLRRYRCAGDRLARDELVRRFLPLARRLARRYDGADEPLDDLVQVASLGLLKAIDRFDVSRDVAFSSFAVPTVLGELKRHFRDLGWAMRVPRGIQERVLDVRQAVDRLSVALGRTPSVPEVSAEIGATPEEVRDAMEAQSAYHTTSLDAPRALDADEGEALVERFGDDDRRYALVEARESIVEGLRSLRERDRLVLRLRFEEDMTQAQIARRLRLSQMHVSRLIRAALEQIRLVAESDRRAA